MKLGEALSVRARQAQKLNDLRSRIKQNAQQQGDEATPENAEALVAEFIDLSSEHSNLILKINKANAETEVAPGTVLLDLLMEREDLNRQRGTLEMAANSASTNDSYRWHRSELPMKPAVNVPRLREHAENITEKVAELDAQIQTVNWQTEI